ncbi:MAG: purine-binding chemotaxis protein CheW [Methylococcales bacterium]|nr:purine-binding chemotaxis protein CheW [Methylococcales bacterium]
MTSDTQAEQFLTFELAGESYGIDILKILEIRGWEPVRAIPNTPGFIKGALNLRGSIVPIIDLRERFGMKKTEYSPVTVVIVLCVESSQGSCVMGIVADAVSDVLDIKLADIKGSPKLGSKIDTRYMQGIYVGEKDMVMLLDVDKLLDSEEFEVLSSL